MAYEIVRVESGGALMNLENIRIPKYNRPRIPAAEASPRIHNAIFLPMFILNLLDI
jgi:hypothetical protein